MWKKIVKSRARYVTLFLCITVLFNMVIPTRQQEAKAIAPVIVVEAGVGIITSILVGAGIVGTANDMKQMSEDIYNHMDSTAQNDLQNYAINRAKTNASTLIQLPVDLYNTVVGAIRGTLNYDNGKVTTVPTGLGNIVSAETDFINYTNPIDIASLPKYYQGLGPYNITATIGTATVNWATETDKWYNHNTIVTITLANGIKYRYWVSNFQTGATYTQQIRIYAPVIYATANGVYQLRFPMMRTLADGTTIEGRLAFDGTCSKSVDGGATWQDYTGNLYNDIIGNSALPANAPVGSVTNNYYYQNVINGTATKPVDVNLPAVNTDGSVCVDDVLHQSPSEAMPYADVQVGESVMPSEYETSKPDVLDSVQTWLSGLWDFFKAIPQLLKGLWDFLIDILNKILNAIKAIPGSLYSTLVSALTYVFAPNETVFTDTFTTWKTTVINKYPNDLALLNSLQVSGEPFNDIPITIMGSTGVIVESSPVNDYIEWIRGATSCFWGLLLILYLWNKINYFLTGNHIIQGKEHGTYRKTDGGL